jgi:hypothetical protein
MLQYARYQEDKLYLVPASGIFPALDSIASVPGTNRVLLFQCTIAGSHDITDRVVDVFEYLPEGRIEVIFVVALSVHTRWRKPQKIVRGRPQGASASPKAEALLKDLKSFKIQQRVLVVPEPWLPATQPAEPQPQCKQRGRKPGSKNKKKVPVVV